jgi:hypothetical protein
VAGAEVAIWINLASPRAGYAAGQPISDASGHFSLSNEPVGTALIFAYKDGWRQPCATVFDITGNTSHDVLLVSDPSYVGAALPAALTTAPSLTGIVYETTPAGRVPVAGASVGVEVEPDLPTATTMTDANGRYLMCGLPSGTKGFPALLGLSAGKDGYGTADVATTLSGPVTTLDVEIRKTSASSAARVQKDKRKPN